MFGLIRVVCLIDDCEINSFENLIGEAVHVELFMEPRRGAVTLSSMSIFHETRERA